MAMRYVATQTFTDQFTGREFKEGAGVRPFPSRSHDLPDTDEHGNAIPDDRPLDRQRFDLLLARGYFKEVVEEPAAAEASADAAPVKRTAKADG